MNDSKVKNAFVPKAFASVVVGSHDDKKEGDLGKPVAILTLASVQSSIAKSPTLKDQRVIEKDKTGEPGKTLADFLTDCAKLSETQGFLSQKDLERQADIVQLTVGCGTPDFQLLVRRLISRGYIAKNQGKTAKDLGATTVDASDLDF